MKESHYLKCEAPICSDDTNPSYKDEVIWHPGEEVCMKGPYEQFQKIQLEINKLVKLGKFKNIDKNYTANNLESGSV